MKRVRNRMLDYNGLFVVYHMDRCREGRCYSQALMVHSWERENARDDVAGKLRRVRTEFAARIVRLELKWKDRGIKPTKGGRNHA